MGALMFNLTDLQADRYRKAQAAKEILDKAEKSEGGPRALTDDEISIVDTLKNDIAKLDAQITSVETTRKQREEVQKIVDRLNEPVGRNTVPEAPVAGPKFTQVRDDALNFTVPATCRHYGKLKAFKGDQAEKRAYKSGMWALATLFRHPQAIAWCKNYGNFGQEFQNALSTGSNPDGGFLVPDEFARTIIELREEYGVFRQHARVWTMGSDTLTIPRRTGGVTWGAIGEAATISDTSPTGDSVMLVAKKSGGLVKLSTEINEDAAVDVADWVAREFAIAAAKFEDDCAFIGDGTSTYHGIRGLENLMTESSALTGAVLAGSGHDTLAEIDTSDIASVLGRLPQYARANAKIFCSQMVAEMVFGRLQASAGGNTVGTLGGELAGRSYLGWPIVISQVLEDSTGTINSTAIFFFGDLSKSSALGDRRGLRVMPSDHRYLDSDQIGIRCTSRFDIVHHDIGTTSVAGPIVCLLGNT